MVGYKGEDVVLGPGSLDLVQAVALAGEAGLGTLFNPSAPSHLTLSLTSHRKDEATSKTYI